MVESRSIASFLFHF